jgi:hypothetical protein
MSILQLELMVSIWGVAVLGTFWSLDNDPLEDAFKKVIALWSACLVVCALVWRCSG